MLATWYRKGQQEEEKAGPAGVKGLHRHRIQKLVGQAHLAVRAAALSRGLLCSKQVCLGVGGTGRSHFASAAWYRRRGQGKRRERGRWGELILGAMLTGETSSPCCQSRRSQPRHFQQVTGLFGRAWSWQKLFCICCSGCSGEEKGGGGE